MKNYEFIKLNGQYYKRIDSDGAVSEVIEKKDNYKETIKDGDDPVIGEEPKKHIAVVEDNEVTKVETKKDDEKATYFKEIIESIIKELDKLESQLESVK